MTDSLSCVFIFERHRLTKSSEQPLFVARAEPKKGGLTREEEPEEYWMDANTKAGKSPMQDPLAIIGVIGKSFF